MCLTKVGIHYVQQETKNFKKQFTALCRIREICRNSAMFRPSQTKPSQACQGRMQALDFTPNSFLHKVMICPVINSQWVSNLQRDLAQPTASGTTIRRITNQCVLSSQGTIEPKTFSSHIKGKQLLLHRKQISFPEKFC